MSDAAIAAGSQPRPVAGRSGPPPRRWWRSIGLIGPALVLALVAVSLWRFTQTDAPGDDRVAARSSLTLEEEIASLEAASSDRPDDITVLQRLGTAYAKLAHQNADPTLYNKADTAFERADAIIPDAADTLIARANVQAVRHQFASSHQLASAALARNPLDADALVVLVDSEIELGRYDDATTHLQTLLDHQPGMAALARASYLRELHGDLDGALLALRQAEAAGSQAAPADRAQQIRIRGDVLFNHGRVDDAAHVYNDILSIEPGYPDARIGLARVSAARGDIAGAIASLESLLAEVNDPHAWIALADLQAFAGLPDDASRSAATVRTLLAADEASGSSIDLELALFDADHSGDLASALERATRAYRDRPSVHGADALAWALHRNGRPAEAVRYIDEALRLGSVDGTLRYHAAAIYAANDDPTRAKAQLAQAFQINPWFSFVLHDEARSLAEQLGVPPPVEWR